MGLLYNFRLGLDWFQLWSFVVIALLPMRFNWGMVITTIFSLSGFLEWKVESSLHFKTFDEKSFTAVIVQLCLIGPMVALLPPVQDSCVLHVWSCRTLGEAGELYLWGDVLCVQVRLLWRHYWKIFQTHNANYSFNVLLVEYIKKI